MPDLLYEVADNVAVVTLNLPEQLNAITFEMLEALSRALRRPGTTRTCARSC